MTNTTELCASDRMEIFEPNLGMKIDSSKFMYNCSEFLSLCQQINLARKNVRSISKLIDIYITLNYDSLHMNQLKTL